MSNRFLVRGRVALRGLPRLLHDTRPPGLVAGPTPAPGRRRPWRVAPLIVAAVGLVPATGAASAEPVRLLAVGDSITHGDGSSNQLGFRDDLYQLLTDAGLDVLMVGSMGASPHRGHFSGGKRIRQFYPHTYGNGWGTGTVDVTGDVAVLLPRVVLIHLGTNDINSYHTPFTPYSDNGGQTLFESAAGRMAELISYILQWSDGTLGDHVESIVLSRIIPMHYRDDDVRAFNAEIDRMIEDFDEGSITGRPERVLLADAYHRFAANPRLFSFGRDDWMSDDLHPNDAGYAQLGALYADLVREAVGDFEPPAAPPLALADRAGRAIGLEWSAPGDDGQLGRALRYDLRFSTEPIDESNFRRATRVLSEPDPAGPGTSQSLRIGALDRDRTYHFALRVVDDAANRAPLALLTARTTEDAGYSTDAFARGDFGEAWARGTSVRLVEGAATVPAGDPELAHLAVYTPENNAGVAEIVFGPQTTAAGAGSAGVALRLDRASSAARGYAVVHDAAAPAHCRLYEVRDGRAVALIDEVEVAGAGPGAGDRLGVTTDEAGGAFLFRVYLNGTFRAELRDPDRRLRTSQRYAGFLLGGDPHVSVDRINILRPIARAAPEPAAGLSPAGGRATGLEPQLVWRPALDPNVGQTVRYAVYLDTEPGMSAPDSVSGLEQPLWVADRALAPLTAYYWQVRAYDTSGRGSLSAVAAFVTASGAAGVDDQPLPGFASGLLGATPNPFNPRTRIDFRLAAAGTARLAVYDVQGRLVRGLLSGGLAAGEHAVWWDGRDAGGRRLASGVYLLYLEADGGHWRHKVVLAR